MNNREIKNNDLDEMTGDKRPLSPSEITVKLRGFPGWVFKNDEISKQFEFPTFMDAINFVNNLAPICEKMGHHPDIFIYYKKITFKLQRYHSGQKVTDLDFKSAREIENLYTKQKQAVLNI